MKKLTNPKAWCLREGMHRFKVSGFISIQVQDGVTRMAVLPGNSIMELPVSTRYRCNCDPDIMDDQHARYAQQVLLELPEGPERQRRIREGLSSQVSIDPCIVELIYYLWYLGVETLGCCCGHNALPGYVDVPEEQFELMHNLGYQKWPVNEHGHGRNSFIL